MPAAVHDQSRHDEEHGAVGVENTAWGGHGLQEKVIFGIVVLMRWRLWCGASLRPVIQHVLVDVERDAARIDTSYACISLDGSRASQVSFDDG